jgi:hypothetical protein
MISIVPFVGGAAAAGPATASAAATVAVIVIAVQILLRMGAPLLPPAAALAFPALWGTYVRAPVARKPGRMPRYRVR